MTQKNFIEKHDMLIALIIVIVSFVLLFEVFLPITQINKIETQKTMCQENNYVSEVTRSFPLGLMEMSHSCYKIEGTSVKEIVFVKVNEQYYEQEVSS